MKSYTNLEQSKTLAKILPFESADMYYPWDIDSKSFLNIPIVKDDSYYVQGSIPCWSLAALLGVLPYHLIVDNQVYAFSMVKGLNRNGETYAIKYAIFNTTFYLHLTDFYNNPVDACVAMIEKLHELNLL